MQMWTFFFETGGHLLARRAVDALVGDTAFPMTQEEVFFSQGLEAPPLECIGPNVGHSPLYFPFVLRFRGATRDNVHAVVSAEVGQFWIDLRIKPVGLQHRRFHIVEIQQQRRTPKIRRPFSRHRMNVSVSCLVTASL